MEASKHTFVAETGQPAQRRKKARLACNPCRARKTGCDGRKPVCSACSMRDWVDKCSYPNSVMQPSTVLTLVDIDRRLQKLENAQAGQDASRTSQSLLPQHPPPSLDVTAPDAGHAGPPPAKPRLAASTGTSFGHVAVDERPSDDTVAAAPPREPPAPSSMASIREEMEVPGHQGRPYDLATSPESPPSPESPTFPNLVGFSQPAPERPRDEFDLQNLNLPSRTFANELLRWYWQNFHSIFPLLHWPMFESKYKTLWKPKPPPRPPRPPFDDILFYATVNMVMALACLRLDRIPLEQRQKQAEEFYYRSTSLVSIEMLDTASIPIVQLLLLRALYLYFAGKADRCWLMSGAAIRVAIGLGLHLEPRKHLNQLEKEMRRRIWFGGCVSLDQVVSVSFGRPGLVTPSLTQTGPPLAIDEEYLSTTAEEGRQPEGVPSRLDMMTVTLKTMKIVEEMTKVGSAPYIKLKFEGAEVAMPEPSGVLRVNAMIDDLLQGLPEHLRMDADYSKMSVDEETAKFFQMQSHAIWYRLLIIRVFLLRPSLLAEAQRWTNPAASSAVTATSMLHARLHHEICMLCLQTVHTMLEEIHQNPATAGGISAWYALHFTFASATILLVATLSPNLCVCLDQEPAKTSWDRVMAILNFHKPIVASASRGIEVLQRYRESIRRRATARLGVPTTTAGMQCFPNVALAPIDYIVVPEQQHPESLQGQLGHVPPPWGTLPTPPTVGSGIMEDIDPYYGLSGALGDAWLALQDYGQNNWVLRLS
ncbi:hypothetical protein VTH06DRAFT_3211 [Thermothelomyces fergusii]